MTPGDVPWFSLCESFVLEFFNRCLNKLRQINQKKRKLLSFCSKNWQIQYYYTAFSYIIFGGRWRNSLHNKQILTHLVVCLFEYWLKMYSIKHANQIKKKILQTWNCIKVYCIDLSNLQKHRQSNHIYLYL